MNQLFFIDCFANQNKRNALSLTNQNFVFYHNYKNFGYAEAKNLLEVKQFIGLLKNFKKKRTKSIVFNLSKSSVLGELRFDHWIKTDKNYLKMFHRAKRNSTKSRVFRLAQSELTLSCFNKSSISLFNVCIKHNTKSLRTKKLNCLRNYSKKNQMTWLYTFSRYQVSFSQHLLLIREKQRVFNRYENQYPHFNNGSDKKKNYCCVNVSNKQAIFFNRCFDKGRLKALISWYLVFFGQKKTVELVEKLKDLGFQNATKAGISLSVDDLKISPTKANLIRTADYQTYLTSLEFEKGNLTSIERFQHLIDTWHRTSELLKQNVIDYFRSTDVLNPVYMMAFSGARGNISQVRQLVGMRGLMADPQGQIIDFPIQSNFREGLTLTEYVISCYGARKGLVDTALRTATSGYLTRRLVDVAQHVIVSIEDCQTNRGVLVNDLILGNKVILSLKARLIGRVLAEDIFSDKITNNRASLDSNELNSITPIQLRNQEITENDAYQISQIRTQVKVRSPLTCEAKNSVCQFCYGWGLATSQLVDFGEAVGVIAAQSIGEPGTQLTMRTFHTGGVFSADIMDQIQAPYNGKVYYTKPIEGSLTRTPYGKIAFLTKNSGQLIILSEHLVSDANSHSNQKEIQILPYTLLFVRHKEQVIQDQLIGEFSSLTAQKSQSIKEQKNIYSEITGEVFFNKVFLYEKIIHQKIKKQQFLFSKEIISESACLGWVWILSAKRNTLTWNLFPNTKDLFFESQPIHRASLNSIDRNSMLPKKFQTSLQSSLNNFPVNKKIPAFSSLTNFVVDTPLVKPIQNLGFICLDGWMDFSLGNQLRKAQLISPFHPNLILFSFLLTKISYKKLNYFLNLKLPQNQEVSIRSEAFTQPIQNTHLNRIEAKHSLKGSSIITPFGENQQQIDAKTECEEKGNALHSLSGNASLPVSRFQQLHSQTTTLINEKSSQDLLVMPFFKKQTLKRVDQIGHSSLSKHHGMGNSTIEANEKLFPNEAYKSIQRMESSEAQLNETKNLKNSFNKKLFLQLFSLHYKTKTSGFCFFENFYIKHKILHFNKNLNKQSREARFEGMLRIDKKSQTNEQSSIPPMVYLNKKQFNQLNTIDPKHSSTPMPTTPLNTIGEFRTSCSIGGIDRRSVSLKKQQTIEQNRIPINRASLDSIISSKELSPIHSFFKFSVTTNESLLVFKKRFFWISSYSIKTPFYLNNFEIQSQNRFGSSEKSSIPPLKKGRQSSNHASASTSNIMLCNASLNSFCLQPELKKKDLFKIDFSYTNQFNCLNLETINKDQEKIFSKNFSRFNIFFKSKKFTENSNTIKNEIVSNIFISYLDINKKQSDTTNYPNQSNETQFTRFDRTAFDQIHSYALKNDLSRLRRIKINEAQYSQWNKETHQTRRFYQKQDFQTDRYGYSSEYRFFMYKKADMKNPLLTQSSKKYHQQTKSQLKNLSIIPFDEKGMLRIPFLHPLESVLLKNKKNLNKKATIIQSKIELHSKKFQLDNTQLTNTNKVFLNMNHWRDVLHQPKNKKKINSLVKKGMLHIPFSPYERNKLNLLSRCVASRENFYGNPLNKSWDEAQLNFFIWPSTKFNTMNFSLNNQFNKQIVESSEARLNKPSFIRPSQKDFQKHQNSFNLGKLDSTNRNLTQCWNNKNLNFMIVENRQGCKHYFHFHFDGWITVHQTLQKDNQTNKVHLNKNDSQKINSLSVQPGWIYFPSNQVCSSQLLCCHKSLYFNGDHLIDDILFDQQIIYSEFISVPLNKLPFDSNDQLSKKLNRGDRTPFDQNQMIDLCTSNSFDLLNSSTGLPKYSFNFQSIELCSIDLKKNKNQLEIQPASMVLFQFSLFNAIPKALKFNLFRMIPNANCFPNSKKFIQKLSNLLIKVQSIEFLKESLNNSMTSRISNELKEPIDSNRILAQQSSKLPNLLILDIQWRFVCGFKNYLHNFSKVYNLLQKGMRSIPFSQLNNEKHYFKGDLFSKENTNKNDLNKSDRTQFDPFELSNSLTNGLKSRINSENMSQTKLRESSIRFVSNSYSRYWPKKSSFPIFLMIRKVNSYTIFSKKYFNKKIYQSIQMGKKNQNNWGNVSPRQFNFLSKPGLASHQSTKMNSIPFNEKNRILNKWKNESIKNSTNSYNSSKIKMTSQSSISRIKQKNTKLISLLPGVQFNTVPKIRLPLTQIQSHSQQKFNFPNSQFSIAQNYGLHPTSESKLIQSQMYENLFHFLDVKQIKPNLITSVKRNLSFNRANIYIRSSHSKELFKSYYWLSYSSETLKPIKIFSNLKFNKQLTNFFSQPCLLIQNTENQTSTKILDKTNESINSYNLSSINWDNFASINRFSSDQNIEGHTIEQSEISPIPSIFKNIVKNSHSKEKNTKSITYLASLDSLNFSNEYIKQDFILSNASSNIKNIQPFFNLNKFKIEFSAINNQLSQFQLTEMPEKRNSLSDQQNFISSNDVRFNDLKIFTNLLIRKKSLPENGMRSIPFLHEKVFQPNERTSPENLPIELRSPIKSFTFVEKNQFVNLLNVISFNFFTNNLSNSNLKNEKTSKIIQNLSPIPIYQSSIFSNIRVFQKFKKNNLVDQSEANIFHQSKSNSMQKRNASHSFFNNPILLAKHQNMFVNFSTSLFTNSPNYLINLFIYIQPFNQTQSISLDFSCQSELSKNQSTHLIKFDRKSQLTQAQIAEQKYDALNSNRNNDVFSGLSFNQLEFIQKNKADLFKKKSSFNPKYHTKTKSIQSYDFLKQVSQFPSEIIKQNEISNLQKTNAKAIAYNTIKKLTREVLKLEKNNQSQMITLNESDHICLSTFSKIPLSHLGEFIQKGSAIAYGVGSTSEGQIISIQSSKITIRRGIPIFFLKGGIFHVNHGNFVDAKSSLITLSYQRLKTEDIVQGIPKIEEFFEARQTDQLHTFFEKAKNQYSLPEAVRKSLEIMQQIIVNGVQSVYQSQGVNISDKHVEIIVRQMTSKVRIVEGGNTGLLKGELVLLDWIELINLGTYGKKAQYEPVILGITKAALETESFISAASFQETTRILSRAAIENKIDFLRGLKENVILGHFIPAGTGFSRFF